MGERERERETEDLRQRTWRRAAQDFPGLNRRRYALEQCASVDDGEDDGDGCGSENGSVGSLGTAKKVRTEGKELRKLKIS